MMMSAVLDPDGAQARQKKKLKRRIYRNKVLVIIECSQLEQVSACSFITYYVGFKLHMAC